MGAAEQHAVEDAHGVQLARARAHERVPRRLARLLRELGQATVLVAPRAPQAHLGRQLVALPRVRADVVAEQRLVVAAAQAVVAAVLLVGPADRQIRARADLLVDDRTIAHGRTDHRVAATVQRREQLVERVALQRVAVGLTHASPFSLPAHPAATRRATVPGGIPHREGCSRMGAPMGTRRASTDGRHSGESPPRASRRSAARVTSAT